MRWLKSGERDEMADDMVAMRRYARSLAGDLHDADDIVQDALVRAMERHQTYQPERNRIGWLLAIVHNVFVSGKRREAADARRNARFAETMLANVAPEQEERARLALVARAFAELPAHHRAVLHLVVIEGLSYQEAAQVLDIPIGTVMSRLGRARNRLRQGEADCASVGVKLRVIGERDDR